MRCCKNCKYAFEFRDIDEYREVYYKYYCHFDNSCRPLCGSLEVNEYFGMPMEEDYQRQRDKWLDWASEHYVSGEDFCNNYRKKKEGE